MPFALFIIGAVLVAAAVRGTHKDLFSLLKGDFTGSGNFLYWVVAILAVGVIGYVPRLKAPSDAFLTLVLLVMVISNQGFFAKFNEQIREGSASPAPAPATPPTQKPAPYEYGAITTTPGSAASVSPGTTPWAAPLPASY